VKMSDENENEEAQEPYRLSETFLKRYHGLEPERIIWKPQRKQALALACPAFELFYGGAAGGGKSDFLLADFLQGVNEYGKHHRGIFFRRTVGELEEVLLRATELYIPLGAIARGIGNGRPSFVFPSGARIKFRYLESDTDVTRYQGHQYTWIAFDELTNNPTDYPYTYMISRCRSPYGAACRVRTAGNPGGRGHGWVKQRFIDGIIPYEINHIDVGDGKTMSRCYIPSTLDDNTVLTRNDPEYETRLRMLNNSLYNALRYGNWDIADGCVFDEFSRDTHVVKPFTLKGAEWVKVCSMDWGYSRPYSIGWWAVNKDGRAVRYRELYGCEKGEANKGVKESALSVAQKAWELSQTEGVDTMIADPAVWGKMDKDDASIAEKFESVGWKMVKGNNDRLNGLQIMHDMLINTAEDGRPMLLIFNTCVDFIRTIPLLMPSPTRPEDVDSTMEDHIYDESRYFLMSDFVKHPIRALKKQNSQYGFKRVSRGASWNPYA